MLCSIVAECVFQLVWHRRGDSLSEDTIALFFFLTVASFCLFVEMSFSCNQSLDGSFPPSPAEGRGSNRLSWGSLLQRLTELKGINQGVREDPQCSRSETGSVADMSLSESDSSFFCYPLEETLAAEVVATITQSLTEASHILACSKLIIPDCLLHYVRQELLHLAVSEPCGLRGALIDLCVDRGDQGPLCTVDQIAVDSTLVPTFHVTLVLRPESSGLWPKMQKLFKGSKSPTARHQDSLRLSTSFRAIKRKLYSSGELLIEECC
ncbi:DNA damage-inducible transcript 4 protein-like [Notolabrus celidotus]|uniref:DNA damage-inducible transcript 4 protein-like n=1 Tax=Notolabrus celidotus TaxID=1203425 RepID=UPI001490510D|nr:DNA damage-inducible transcript 4 protein-like [Notolabrus celidotus]